MENIAQGEAAPPHLLSSTYPSAPMEYVNMFSTENVKQDKVPQPPPLIKDSYTSFGKFVDPNSVLIRSLESQGIRRLYKLDDDQVVNGGLANKVNTTNHKRELKKLNHSILVAYLDLLDILVKAPTTLLNESKDPNDLMSMKTLRDQKLEDIELLFVNMHHLINELRPHQARDNIRCLLEMQKRQRTETANKFRLHLFKIVELLKKCIQSIQKQQQTDSSRCNYFLEELNSFIKDANKISKSLEQFNGSNQLNASNDVEMKSSQESLEDHSLIKQKNTLPKGDNNQKNATANNKCDLKELILCDLIDDLLTKENEF
jgi:mediator of RNA polymerase II transcription subunit 7